MEEVFSSAAVVPAPRIQNDRYVIPDVVGTAVCGRFVQCLDFWKNELQCDQFVLSCVEFGYKIPFYDYPDPSVCFMSNNKSALNNSDFVTAEIQTLLKNNCIRRADRSQVKMVSPLSVATNKVGKKRLILDLRVLNDHLLKHSIRFEDVRSVVPFMSEGVLNYASVFDLKSGYHHCSIHPDDVCYLGFEWDGQIYVFLVLPFGLSTAPYLFTKVLRPFLRYWRMKGILCALFLDDGLVGGESVAVVSRAVEIVRWSLAAAGWVVSEEKSHWDPSSTVTWLGFDFNFSSCTVSVSAARVDNALKRAAEVSESAFVSSRVLSRFSSSIISMGFVLGGTARLFTRFCSMEVAKRHGLGWDVPFLISEDVRSEVSFWVENLSGRNSRFFDCRSRFVRFVFSDASGVGCGAFIASNGDLPESVFRRVWTAEEAVLSSTYRELLVVYYALREFGQSLSGAQVVWYTDNQGVVRIIEVGSMKTTLQQVAVNIYGLCARFGISLQVHWIPREDNQRADFLSRIHDDDDWRISDFAFAECVRFAGEFSIDLFACHTNARCPRFYCGYWCPGILAVDAFAHSWEGEHAWVLPSPSDLVKVILKIRSTRMTGIIVFPFWPAQKFWPLVAMDGCGGDDNVVFHSIFKSVYIWPKDTVSPFLRGSRASSVFARETFHSPVVFAYFDSPGGV